MHDTGFAHGPPKTRQSPSQFRSVKVIVSVIAPPCCVLVCDVCVEAGTKQKPRTFFVFGRPSFSTCGKKKRARGVSERNESKLRRVGGLCPRWPNITVGSGSGRPPPVPAWRAASRPTDQGLGGGRGPKSPPPPFPPGRARGEGPALTGWHSLPHRPETFQPGARSRAADAGGGGGGREGKGVVARSRPFPHTSRESTARPLAGAEVALRAAPLAWYVVVVVAVARGGGRVLCVGKKRVGRPPSACVCVCASFVFALACPPAI